MVRQYNLQYVLWKLLSFQQNKKNILHWKCIFREAVRSKHRKFLTKVALSKEILLTSSLVQVFFFFFKKKNFFVLVMQVFIVMMNCFGELLTDERC